MTLHRTTLALALLLGCGNGASAPSSPPPLEPAPPPAPPTPGASLDLAARNLDGMHTRRDDRPCSLFVASGGRDTATGRSAAAALRRSARAVDLARPGDVVCFASGTYRGVEIQDVHATAEAPLVLRRMPDATEPVVLTGGAPLRGVGVSIRDSTHVQLLDLRIEDTLIGVDVVGSSFVRLDGLSIEHLGQGAIHLGRARGGEPARFLGPPSHHCDVVDNSIRDTGNRVARYGEGVYVGTGAEEGDGTHDVFVAYNRFEDVRAEAIELKPGTSRCVVRGNRVLSASHFFHGAISVGAQAFGGPSADFLVEDNVVTGVRSTGDEAVSGILIGHGNGVVRNNVVWGVEGGRGIRTTTTFMNPEARRVLIEHNTVWTPGGGPSIALHDGHERTGVLDHPGDVVVRDCLTDDGSAGSTVARREEVALPL